MHARQLGIAPLGPRGKKWLEDWHDANVPRVMADATFRRALEALYARSAIPAESPIGNEFRDAVALLASLAVARTAKREGFEQLWAQNSGKTWKALTRFPERLRNLAKEIAQMNGSLFFSPRLLVGNKVPGDSVQGLVHRLSEVPTTLFYLANGIEAVAKELPAATSEHYWRRPGHSPWIDELSERVEFITGRPHDSEVAKLLNAAEAVLHPNKRGKNKGFDAQTLANFRSRRRQKSVKT
jgi:hypothetical protein